MQDVIRGVSHNAQNHHAIELIHYHLTDTKPVAV